MMVVGESGLGKSTVVNSLFLSGKLIYSENLNDRPPIIGNISVTDCILLVPKEGYNSSGCWILETVASQEIIQV